jgi:hypothetical protein
MTRSSGVLPLMRCPAQIDMDTDCKLWHQVSRYTLEPGFPASCKSSCPQMVELSSGCELGPVGPQGLQRVEPCMYAGQAGL